MSKKNKAGKSGIVYSTDPDFSPEEEQAPVETLPPADQKLQVKLDTKHRAGKVVTLVEGFIGSYEDLLVLGKELKTRCGTGGSVKDGVIIIQGDYKIKIIEWLKSHGYGCK